MVNPELIRKRLNKLDEYLTILHSLQKYSYEGFVNDPEHYGSAERFLQLAIECVNDMGNHVIADERMGVVNWYSDIPAILFEKGLIDASLRERWLRMIGFRNILVHEYLEIDRSIVFDVLQLHLEDLGALRGVFARFL